MEKQVTLSDLKKGDYFRRIGGKTVFIRGEYDRSSKKYSVCKFDDLFDEKFLHGKTPVEIDFEF